jgi:glucose-1-phosphate thymidylyltransferase
LTHVISKQLLPVFDKPMIYYPLSILLLAGIKEVLIITTPHDNDLYRRLLGDGSRIGVALSYAIQEQPNGLAEAFLIGADFIGDDSVCLILGDNILYGESLPALLRKAMAENNGATIFAYWVKDPQSYGVVEFDGAGRVLSIEEKPERPRSNYVIPGLYFFDSSVTARARAVRPSARGELEITDVLGSFLKDGCLTAVPLGRGIAWLDSGTVGDLHEAAGFVEVIENRQGLKIACIEEVAYRMGYISLDQLEALARPLAKSHYGKYLENIVHGERR